MSKNIIRNLNVSLRSLGRIRTHPQVTTALQTSDLLVGLSKFSTSQIDGSISATKPDWNQAITDAEKIVGYSTSILALRSLFSDEMSNLAVHMRKLVGSSHPLLKTAKRLVYNGKTNMQTRGLLVLLISKAANTNIRDGLLSKDSTLGVLEKQRSLAEITELIHTAQLIHRGVVNVSTLTDLDVSSSADMEYGNKIAILSGDYFLAKACASLAALGQSEVIGLIGTAITDFMEAEFIGLRDSRNNPLPSKEFTLQDWEKKNVLGAGSLLANSCKSSAILADHEDDVKDLCFEFGKHIGLAWQCHSELQRFVDTYSYPAGREFDFSSLPVVLHLSKSPEPFLSMVAEAGNMVETSHYAKLHSLVNEGSTIAEAKSIYHHHTQAAFQILQKFETSDARTALENITRSLS